MLQCSAGFKGSGLQSKSKLAPLVLFQGWERYGEFFSQICIWRNIDFLHTFWINLCLDWQTLLKCCYFSYTCCLHCSYFDCQWKGTLQQQFSFCHGGQEILIVLNYFNYWQKCFRINEKCETWYGNAIVNALCSSEIIFFLFLHNNLIKIIFS